MPKFRSKKSDSEEKKLLVRLPNEMHRQLRLLAFYLNISMAELCRKDLEIVINSHVKQRQSKP
ncbi:MAG: hypothetical protein HYX61_07685 [Gammaproteobacteria bacterium]|nr:hypothetical protein [Gammaproteobacteria bacterium]